MLEVVIISVILFIIVGISLLVIGHILTHKRRPLDYSGWIVGIIISDIFLLILGVAAIFGYLQVA